MKASEKHKKDTKWVFLQKGTCSRTMFYILNHEFGNQLDDEEQAADQLAGGIMQQGYQCGLLWGTAFGVGAEFYKRKKDLSHTIYRSIEVCGLIDKGFVQQTGSSDCEDIVNMDVSGSKGALKLLVTGKFISCLRMTDKWAPKALELTTKALNEDTRKRIENPRSCASEVVLRLGGNDMEAAIASGLAGGIGLSGKGCGALSAAIWFITLQKVRETGKVDYPNPDATKILEAFLAETDYKYECKDICGRHFNSVEEHTEFLNNGGCSQIIKTLSGQ